MKNQLFFVSIILMTVSLFCSSCEDTNLNNLVGTWEYQQIVITDCNDPLDDAAVDYTGDGDCEALGGITICTKFTLEMDDTAYRLRQIVSTDGNEVSTIIEEGEYSIVPSTVLGPSIQFCTDLVCRVEGYFVTGNTLTMNSEDPNTGCNTVVTAQKN